MSTNVTMETIVSLCKRRGFIFQSSEIYGGMGNTWDYGPLGVELKRNVKEAWWRAMVYERDDVEGLDAAILMHPRVWEASGHVEGFKDPMVDCRETKARYRADQLLVYRPREGVDHRLMYAFPEDQPELGLRRLSKSGLKQSDFELVRLLDIPLEEYPRILAPAAKTPGTLTAPRQFNLMFKTFVGPVEDDASVVYLRPETAQGIFANFHNVATSMRRKLPFGIAQIGKAFRNEITPKNFIFRTLEFEQMEIEYFVKPGDDEEWYQRWVETRFQWYARFGIRAENLRLRDHEPDELAHYAKACKDVEYRFPMGWMELEGIANRTDFDLRRHAEYSGKDLRVFDEVTRERFFPYVIEPSAGADRSTLAFLLDAYREEEVRGRKRTVLGFHKALAPVKAAVLPLLRKDGRLVELARRLASELRRCFNTQYDDTANIGRLYRRQDEIGTLFCVTVDVETLDDQQATVRDRDTMEQVRIPIDRVREYLLEQLAD